MKVTWQLICLVVAVVCAGVFTVFGFDWFTNDHPFGWLGAAIFFGLASRLP